ncbi:Zinc knuckle protein, partial [Penicillium capsulatum]
NSVRTMLSRRACYKCGNLGHYAEVCSSTERLCYNCKQPGMSFGATVFDLRGSFHSKQGTSPAAALILVPLRVRTIPKQCYNCQGVGHVQADCPTLRLNGGANGRCYNCNQPGHLARNCTNPAAPNAGRPAGPRGGMQGFRGGFGGYPRAATCYKCGGPNHFARDCQAQAMKCYACGKLGHISRDCTAPNGGPLSSTGKVCYKCSQAGHISRDCPANTEAAAKSAVDAAAAPAPAPVATAATTTVEASTEAAPVTAAAPTTAVA